MPRTPIAPEKPSRSANEGLELSRHKRKIRALRQEIAKLRWSLQTRNIGLVAGAERPPKPPKPKLKPTKTLKPKREARLIPDHEAGGEAEPPKI
jgi:hypothetical protein